jgi:hypothetical protein
MRLDSGGCGPKGEGVASTEANYANSTGRARGEGMAAGCQFNSHRRVRFPVGLRWLQKERSAKVENS